MATDMNEATMRNASRDELISALEFHEDPVVRHLISLLVDHDDEIAEEISQRDELDKQIDEIENDNKIKAALLEKVQDQLENIAEELEAAA